MEKRVEKLEEFVEEARAEMRAIDVRLVKIEKQLKGIHAQMATKADLPEGITGLIKWIVGTAIVLSASAVTIMTFVLNNAVPKAHSAAPAPTVITLPAPAAAAAPSQLKP
jgi:hypothetical protein